jgi:flagellar biosynthesis anti-sigma factor FlgM
MSIERLSAESASRTYVKQAQLSRAAAPSEATDGDKAARSAERSDSVVLSTGAKALAAARDAVKASDGDLRSEKVADIKQRLGDGTYQVDARVLARKMLSDSQ